MTEPSTRQHFSAALFDLLDETFDTHHGLFLDRGTSLFETLESVTAEEASRPVSTSCASIAAQVNHVIVYLDVLTRSVQGEEVGKVDWDEAWRIGPVTDEGWNVLRGRLRGQTDHTIAVLKGIERWDVEDEVYGAMAIAVHTAYHLGQIRQALCTIQNRS
jgi:hypothetical protein